MNGATSAHSTRLLALSLAFYRTLLLLYPARFRRAYATQMAQVFHTSCQQACREGGALALGHVWRITLGDLIVTALAERMESVMTPEVTRAPAALYRATGLVSLVGIVLWIIGPIVATASVTPMHLAGGEPPFSVMMVLPIGWLFFIVGFVGLYTWLARQTGWLIWIPGAFAIAILLTLIAATMYWTYNSQIGVQQLGAATVVNLSARSVVNPQLNAYAYDASYLAYPALGLALVVTGLLALRQPALRAAARMLLLMGVVGMLYYFFTDMGAPSLLRNTGAPGLAGMVAGAVVFYGVWLVGWLRLGRWLRQAGALPAPIGVAPAPASTALD